MRRAFSANEDKDEDDFEDDDDDFCRTMENVFGCDFDFSKRFEEEEEKEDEEHAIIAQGVVEAMMTTKTMRLVRSKTPSGLSVMMFYYYGDDFKYLQKLEAPREKWKSSGSKMAGKKLFHLICVSG